MFIYFSIHFHFTFKSMRIRFNPRAALFLLSKAQFVSALGEIPYNKKIFFYFRKDMVLIFWGENLAPMIVSLA